MSGGIPGFMILSFAIVLPGEARTSAGRKRCSLIVPASSILRFSSFRGTYCADSPNPVTPPAVPLPLFAAVSSPISGNAGRVAGVAYAMLMVQVPFAAKGDAVVQVCAVML